MQQQNISSYARPDIFSRDTLHNTFRLLRKTHPQLALDIQNQLQGGRILTSFPHPNSDYFFITLEAKVIGKIVNALTRLGERHFTLAAPLPRSQLRLLRELIQHWVNLGEWIIEQSSITQDSIN